MYPQRDYQQPSRPDSAYYYQDGTFTRPSESRASQYYQPPQQQYFNPPQTNYQFQPTLQSSRPNSSMDSGRVFEYRQSIQARPGSRPNYPPQEFEDKGYTRRSSIVNENRYQPNFTEERRTSIPPPENRYSQPISYPPPDGRVSAASIDSRYQPQANYQPQAFKQPTTGYAPSHTSNRSFYPERMDNYNNRHRRQPSFESLRSNVFNSPAIRLQHPPRYPNESEVGSVRAGSRVGYDENLENRSISSRVDGQNEHNYENGSNYDVKKSVYKSKSALALTTGQSLIRRNQDGTLEQKPLPGVMRQHSKKMEALLNSTSRLGLNDESSKSDLTKPVSPVTSRPAESPSSRRFSSARVDVINSQHFRKIKSIANEVHSIISRGQHLYQEDLDAIKSKIDMQIKCIESLERLSNESPSNIQ